MAVYLACICRPWLLPRLVLWLIRLLSVVLLVFKIPEWLLFAGGRGPELPGVAARSRNGLWARMWLGGLPHPGPAGDLLPQGQCPACVRPSRQWDHCRCRCWPGPRVYPGGRGIACPHAVPVCGRKRQVVWLDGLHGPGHLPPPPTHRCWPRRGARRGRCWASACGVRGCPRHHRRAPGCGDERLPGGRQLVDGR